MPSMLVGALKAMGKDIPEDQMRDMLGRVAVGLLRIHLGENVTESLNMQALTGEVMDGLIETLSAARDYMPVPELEAFLVTDGFCQYCQETAGPCPDAQCPRFDIAEVGDISEAEAEAMFNREMDIVGDDTTEMMICAELEDELEGPTAGARCPICGGTGDMAASIKHLDGCPVKG